MQLCLQAMQTLRGGSTTWPLRKEVGALLNGLVMKNSPASSETLGSGQLLRARR